MAATPRMEPGNALQDPLQTRQQSLPQAGCSLFISPKIQLLFQIQKGIFVKNQDFKCLFKSPESKA